MQYSNAAINAVDSERLITLDASNYKPAKECIVVSALDELFFKKPVRIHLRETAALFSAILFVIAAFVLYKDKPGNIWHIYTVIGSLTFLSGYYVPWSFYPIWKLWMGIASVLERVMTAVIVSLTWFGIFVPFSMIAKLFGARPINLSFAPATVSSYWESRSPESSDFKLLERQF